MIFDYIENVMITLMLINPLNVTPEVIKTASICTQLKGVFTTLSWFVILILFIILISKKTQRT